MSMDKLQEKIREKKNPTVAGLDPKLEYIPDHIKQAAFAQYGKTLKGVAEAYFQFCKGLMDALAPIVPAVKPQSAFYEVLGPDGIDCLQRVVAYAKEKGFYVIMDAKRGDIGSTAEAYAQAYFGGVELDGQVVKPFDCDCLTVNGYLGSDGIQPFLPYCENEEKALFLLVKTSNKSSRELQDLIAGDRVVHTVMADLAVRLSGEKYGRFGYTNIGAVVGATHPQDLKNLRQKYSRLFFLVPGYGAQGGKAKDVANAFDELGHGAVVNSSRGIMCAWQKTESDGTDYAELAAREAVRMRDDIAKYVTVL
jgi:orotidine-5'-phosphate decarboxylase